MASNRISRRLLMQLSGGGLVTGALGLGMKPVFAQSGSIKVWDQFSDEPKRSTFGKVLANYIASSDNEIVREVQLGASVKDIAATALSSGTGPDILQYSVGQGNAGLLADAGLIIPLEDYAAKYKWHERLSGIALNEASLDGKLWGGPQESEVSLIFVNKSLFKKHGWDVPATHDEVVALAREAKKAGIVTIAYGQQDWYPSWWAASHVITNALGSKATADIVYRNEGTFNTPEVVDGIEKYWVELAKAGAFVPQMNALPAADAEALFLAGGALMYMSGTWGVGSVAEHMKGVDKDIMPIWDFSGNPRAYPTGSGSAMYISAASKVKDEAADLINFLYDLKEVTLMIEEASIIAPVPIDASNLKLTDFQKRSVQAIATGDGDPKVNQGVFVNHGLSGSNFHNLLTSGFQALTSGETTPKKLTADLQAAWEKDNA